MGMANPFLSSGIKYLKPYHANTEELKKFASRLEVGDLVDYNYYPLLFRELKEIIEKYNRGITVKYIESGSMQYERTKTAFSFYIDYKFPTSLEVQETVNVIPNTTFMFDEKELVVD